MPRTYKPKYYISSDRWIPAKAAMDNILDDRGHSWATGTKPLWGNRSIGPSSKSAYTTHYRGLKHFCCMIGDYESLIILQENRPTYCTSMKAETVEAFIRFKMCDRSITLKDLEGNTICNIDGTPIKCTKDWAAHKTLKQFISAISALHHAAGNVGDFLEACPDCYTKELAGQGHIGCLVHRGSPKTWRSGQPKNSVVVTNAIQNSARNKASESGDAQLTVFELLQLRQHLMSSNDDVGFQLWVLILVSVKLFLRSEEGTGDKKKDPDRPEDPILPSGLQVDLSFIGELSVVENGVIEALAVRIKGKTDGETQILML
jgi:hypothetical protein